jgi:WD40 repeat protein
LKNLILTNSNLNRISNNSNPSNSINHKKNSSSLNNFANFSLVDLLNEKFMKERDNKEDFTQSNSNCQLIIEDDLKQKTKSPKESNEILRNSNTVLKAIRNEKISQSIKVNKISEIEDEDPQENFSPNGENQIYNQNNLLNLNNMNLNSNSKDQNYKYELQNDIIEEDIEDDLHSQNAQHLQSSRTEVRDRGNKYYISQEQITNSNNNRENISNNNYLNLQNSGTKKSTSNQPNNNNLKYQQNKYSDFNEVNVENSQNLTASQNLFNYNANALDELDEEEYYMKCQYEYYDYDITTLSQKKVIQDTNPIRTSCFSPKGDYFAIGTNSKSVKLFQMKPLLQRFNKKNSYNFKDNNENSHLINDDIKLIFEQKNHHLGSIYCLDWSISGRLIASGSNDKLVKLMVIPDLEESYLLKDQESLELTISGHRGTIRSVSFEPTSDLVLLSAGTIDHTVKVWDAEKGTNITNLEGHTNDVHTIKWSNDALICASSGVDKTIRFWDLRNYKSTSLISALKYSDINDISIYTRNKNMTSTLIAAGHSNGTITVWDYNKRSIVKEIFEHTEEVR